MKLFDKASGVATSPAAGRAVKVVKVLNLIGTVRGAVTTVLLAAGLIGGAATVNNVREDVAQSRASAMPARTAARSPAPTATALTAAGLRADLEKRLQATLATDSQAVEDLRRVAVFSGARLDQLVLETRQKLQARYDQGVAQLAALLEGPSPAPSGATPSATATASISVVAASALVQVITNDLNQIVVQATRAATEPTPIPRTSAPTATTVPTPTHSPVPTPSPRATTPHPSPTR